MEVKVGMKVKLPNGAEGIVKRVMRETQPVGDLLVTYIDKEGEKRSRIVDPNTMSPR